VTWNILKMTPAMECHGNVLEFTVDIFGVRQIHETDATVLISDQIYRFRYMEFVILIQVS